MQFGRLEGDQHVTRLHALALGDRNPHHRACDLGTDVDTMWRLDAAAGHHGLHEVTPLHGLGRHLGPEPPTRRQTRDHQHGKKDERECSAAWELRWGIGHGLVKLGRRQEAQMMTALEA